MNHTEIETLMEQGIRIVREAGKLLSDRALAGKVKEKQKTDFVTAVDIAVQKQICEQLFELDHRIQFLGEEEENSQIDLNRPVWILDPVDGTTNLVHGFTHSTISLALADQGKTVLGIVYDPYADELFTAMQGSGARCNEEMIHVSDRKRLADSLCIVGTNPRGRSYEDLIFEKIRAVYDHCHDIRRLGTASLEMCYVASGRADGYMEFELKVWDYAAARLIVEEAGGRVSGFDGTAPGLEIAGGNVTATNGYIHEELTALL